MSLWAIAYDLDILGMKKAGYARAEVVDFYDAVRGCFEAHYFEKFHQLALYTSERPNCVADACQVGQALSRIPDAGKFVRQLNLFRIEDLNDLLPLVVPGKTSALKDRIWEELDAVFEREEGHSSF